MQRFRCGLVFKAHGLCVSLNSRLESNEEEEEYRAFTRALAERGRGATTHLQIQGYLTPSYERGTPVGATGAACGKTADDQGGRRVQGYLAH